MNRTELELSLKQRVQELVKRDYKASVNKLAGALGIRQTTLNDQINGDSKISAATILSILHTRPDISAEWLLRGVGDKTIPQVPLEAIVARLDQLIDKT